MIRKWWSPQKWGSFWLLFFSTVFILWVPTTGYRNIVGPKHFFFLGASGVFLLGCIPALWQRPKLSKKDWLPFAFAGAFLFMALLSALASEYPELVWLGNRRNEGFLTLAVYMLLFCAMALWGEVGKYQKIGLGITGIVTLILVCFQFFQFNPLNLFPEDLRFHDRSLKYSGEYMGTIGNVDLLSAFLTMATLFLLGTYAVDQKRSRFFCLIAGGASWMALVCSEVSAGPVAIGLCLAILFPLCLYKGIGIDRMGEILGVLLLGILGKSALGYAYDGTTLTTWLRWGAVQWILTILTVMAFVSGIWLRPLKGRAFPKLTKILLLVILIVVLLVLVFLWFYSGENTTLSSLSQLLHGNPPDTLGSSRIAIWKEAVKLGMEKPLLGGGPDTYQRRSEIIFTRELPNGNVRRTSVDAAHNEYLNLWVNVGLPAMLLYLGLLAAVLIPALKNLKGEKLPLVLAVLGYGIHALFGISQSVVSPLFYLLLGALAYQNRRI